MIFICEDCGYEMDYDEDPDEIVECDVNPGVLHVESLKYSQVIGRV